MAERETNGLVMRKRRKPRKDTRKNYGLDPHTYTTTSAELKLLRRRLTFLSPGRPVSFEAGTTTVDALFAIHVSHSTPCGSLSTFFALVFGGIFTSLIVDA